MVRKRQPHEVTAFDPVPGISVASFAYDHARRDSLAPHLHGSDQLLYASSGVMQVEAQRALWLVPPQRAVWIPARTTHSVRMLTKVSMRTLYVAPGLAFPVRSRCRVIAVPALLRELIIEVVRIGTLRDEEPEHVRLRDVLRDRVRRARMLDIELPLPDDPRATRLARRILADPASRTPLAELSASVGASDRTLQRLFRRETGLSVAQWRQVARLHRAVEALARGESVKSAAAACGFSSTSSFVKRFRAVLGAPPGRYLCTEAPVRLYSSGSTERSGASNREG